MRRLVIILFLVYSAVFSYLSIRRHNAFYSSYDLANMDQAVWTSLFSNRPFSVSSGEGLVSRLRFHSDFILILLSPFYLIWNDVRMLLILQSVVIGLGGVAVFLISKKILKREWLSALLALVYLLNPGLQWTNMYDFHGVSLAMTFLLFMIYYAMEKKWWWYALFGILAMLTKEQVPLLVAMVGIFVFFFRSKKAGLITFVGGFLIFGLLVFVVMPPFSETGAHWAWSWFSFGDHPKVSQANLSKIDVVDLYLGPRSKNYYYMLLRPFGFLPILGLPAMLVSMPDLTINLLSSHDQMIGINMHYDSGVVVGVILSLILAFFVIEKVLLKISKKSVNLGLILVSTWLLFWAIKTNYYYSPLPSTPSLWKWMYEVTDKEIEFEKALSKIPTNASTTASSEIRPHLTHRLEAYNLPDGLDSDYIAMTLRNRIVGDNFDKGFETSLKEDLDNNDKYSIVFEKGDYLLYKRISE